MLQQQVTGIKAFEDEKNQGRLNLIIDDIKAATIQLQKLNEENEILSNNLKDVEFNLEELKVEKETLSAQQVQNLDPPSENNFFAYLGSLENREIESSGKIEGQKQLTQELSHNLNRLKQKSIKLKKEYELVQAQLEEEESVLRESNDVLKDLEIKLDEKTKENEFILQQCETLKEELDQRNDELNNNFQNTEEDLRELYRQKSEELRQLRIKNAELHGQLHKTELSQQNEFNSKKDEVARESLVSAWRTDRSILKSRLQKLKTNLFNIQKNLEASNRREKDLEQKYIDLLGEDHNFGNCEGARKCVLANIDFINGAPEKSTPSTAFEYEKDYQQELQEKLASIENSYKVFSEYRESVLNGLNEELQGCSQYGYIRLLQEEFSELQGQLSKLL